MALALQNPRKRIGRDEMPSHLAMISSRRGYEVATLTARTSVNLPSESSVDEVRATHVRGREGAERGVCSRDVLRFGLPIGVVGVTVIVLEREDMADHLIDFCSKSSGLA